MNAHVASFHGGVRSGTLGAMGEVPRRVAQIDWNTWHGEAATLLAVVRGGEILLIRKKRGLGAGKITPPGGKLEAGESPQDAALREVREEVCVRASGVAYAGQLRFQFADGYRLHVWVYRADGCSGRPTETDEAVPHWFPVDKIPYDEMWADDRIWLPKLLAREAFDGRFIFDGDDMVDADMD